MLVSSQSDIIGGQAEEIDLQAKRIGELEKDQSSIWNNTLLWLAAGVAVGALGGMVLSR